MTRCDWAAAPTGKPRVEVSRQDFGVKTLGIVGGIAPPSTIEYYRSIVEIHRNRANRPPRVLISSVDGDVVLGHLMAGRHTDLVAALLEAVQQLASAGAELALLASISVHIAFDDARSNAAAAVADFKRLGLFATRFTMQADLFGPALASRGISMVAPTADEQETIDRVTSMSSSPGVPALITRSAPRHRRPFACRRGH